MNKIFFLLTIFALLCFSAINVNCQQAEGALHEAVAVDNIELVKQLLDKGAEVNKEFGPLKLTPLHCTVIHPSGPPINKAVEGKSAEIALLLIKHGANVNAKSKNGSTPLHLAAYYGFKNLAEVLIQNGADVKIKTDDLGMTPLHAASQRGHFEIAKLLLDKGAEINAKDKEGNTALHRAAVMQQYFNRELPLLLIQSGIDINSKNNQGQTALDIARLVKNESMIELLENYKTKN